MVELEHCQKEAAVIVIKNHEPCVEIIPWIEIYSGKKRLKSPDAFLHPEPAFLIAHNAEFSIGYLKEIWAVPANHCVGVNQGNLVIGDIVFL